MARIEFTKTSGIKSISGRIGNVMFRTINGKTFMTQCPEAELPENPTRKQKEKYKRDRIVDQCVSILQDEMEDWCEAVQQRAKIRWRIMNLYKKYATEIKAPTKLQCRIMREYRAKWSKPRECLENVSMESGKRLDKVLKK